MLVCTQLKKIDGKKSAEMIRKKIEKHNIHIPYLSAVLSHNRNSDKNRKITETGIQTRGKLKVQRYGIGSFSGVGCSFYIFPPVHNSSTICQL